MTTYHINIYKGSTLDEVYDVIASDTQEAIETAMRYYYEANPHHGASRIDVTRELATA